MSKNSVCVHVQAKFWRLKFEKWTPFANPSYFLRFTHKPANDCVDSPCSCRSRSRPPPSRGARGCTRTRRTPSSRSDLQKIRAQFFPFPKLLPCAWAIGKRKVLKKGCVRKLAVERDPFYQRIALARDPWLPKDVWKSVKAKKAAFGTPLLPTTRHWSHKDAASLESSYAAAVMDIKWCTCAFVLLNICSHMSWY